ncbi:hypothetical protein NNC19_05500 [Clostridium sp. SHJSY1]|uniref:right-handed parallel beta-helix repeat-containing protein n=1 Tax=Clostridium sp. SHJSY1 TaxID=2942483 RepID=UPI00287637BB|nr:hypothetical protein [Clostridium sp. SHJSY1]MDS0525129.1 hypothetical protein [Clostridium sp. SHJSY1]
MNKSLKMKICLTLAVTMGSYMIFSGANIARLSNPQAAEVSSTATPPSGPPPDGQGGGQPGGGQTEVVGTATYSQSGGTESKYNEIITASDSDVSPVIVSDSGNLTLGNSTISKTGGDTTSGDSSNFYGLNAGVVAKSASTITLKDSKVTTNAEGANAIFSTGTGSTINVENVEINTTQNSSRGLDATQKGTINAKNVKITTKGAHCAALATDRGEGTVTVSNTSGTTAGEGSPGIYSTGNITATDSNFAATGSEAAVIEGKNSITLTDTSISGNSKHGVMLYQSTSGDAAVGTSTFTTTRGSITTSVGPMFYVTNTDAVVNLNNTNLKNTGDSLVLIDAEGNDNGMWGTAGANPGNLTFNTTYQTMEGNVVCDKISTVNMNLKNNTYYTGTIDTENTGTVNLTLDETSMWTVNGTSYLSAFTDSDTSLSNIKDNGNTIYYDSTNSANSWLNGQTYTLNGGGVLTPAK